VAKKWQKSGKKNSHIKVAKKWQKNLKKAKLTLLFSTFFIFATFFATFRSSSLCYEFNQGSHPK